HGHGRGTSRHPYGSGCGFDRCAPRFPEGIRGNHRRGHWRLPLDRRLWFCNRRVLWCDHLRHGADRAHLYPDRSGLVSRFSRRNASDRGALQQFHSQARYRRALRGGFSMTTPIIEVRNLVKHFGPVIALNGVSLSVEPGQVHCLLGDNGAGKSTLIKTLSGVHKPTSGDYLVEGKPVSFNSPRDALDHGIATVYQDLAMIPLMSVMRNFFLGREPTKGIGPFRWFDAQQAEEVTREEMRKIGIDVRDPQQAVGTLSGGERQCV